MNIFKKFSMIVLAGLAMVSTTALTSCNDDDLTTDQYTGDFKLNVWGPCPVARGGCCASSA